MAPAPTLDSRRREAKPPAACGIRRTVGPFTATGIVVANMIGSGIFVTTGLMAGSLPGPAAVLFCWVLGGAIALSGALCYGELATRMPEEGGEYVYLKRLFHPVFGFLSGWVSLAVGFSAPIAAAAIGFSGYLFAGLDIEGGAMSGLPIQHFRRALSIAIIFLFSLLHYTGVERGTRIQNALTAGKVIVILALAGAGLTWGHGEWPDMRGDRAAPAGGVALGTALTLVMFAYSGWNASAYIAGEIRRPRKTLPVSLVLGTLIVTFVYVAVNLFVLRSLPFAEVQGNVAVVESAAVRAFGPGMGNMFGVIVAFALLSSLSAFVMIGPRIYFAMARDGLFFRFAGQVHSRYRVPGHSILLQAALASIMVVSSSIEQLVVLLMYALNIFPWLAVLGLFIARRRQIGEGSAVRVPGYPALPLFFLASTFVVALVTFLNRPVESAVALLVVLAGVPVYFVWRRAAERTRSGEATGRLQREDIHGHHAHRYPVQR